MRKRLSILFLCLLANLLKLSAQGVQVFFSSLGGFYEDCFSLSLSCAGQSQIRFTTNGATPTASSALYSEPLFLDESLYSKSDIYTIPIAAEAMFYAPDSVQHCITIRAAAFDGAGNRIGPVATQSYFIRALGCDTHGLPVMALAADSLALFDYNTGILVPGVHFDPANESWTGNYYQSGNEWERLVNVEFYELDDNSGINQQAGLRTHGGTCRRQTQKGLKIYAREEYGAKRFKHRFFETIPNNSFKHLVLKPFSYQWFYFGIQDDICNRMAAQLDVESVASRPMVLFLNGEYWGLYYLKEKPDAHYLEDHFDNDDSDYNVVDNWYGYQVDGDTTGFVEMMRWFSSCDLSTEEEYAMAEEKIDLSSFIDYYCLELFIANHDWPANNMRCYQLGDGRWRWIFFDGDDALRDLDFDVFDNATSLVNLGWPTDSRSTLMFRKLLENEGFRKRFARRFNSLLSTQFSYAVTKPYFVDAASLVRNEMPAHCDRFGSPTDLEAWEHSIKVVDRFLYRRALDMSDKIRAFFGYDDVELISNAITSVTSSGNASLTIWSDDFVTGRIVVYDVLGHCLLSQRLVLGVGANEVALPYRLSSGVYLVHFGTVTKKMVVQ